jgi:hypothetical protein
MSDAKVPEALAPGMSDVKVPEAHASPRTPTVPPPILLAGGLGFEVFDWDEPRAPGSDGPERGSLKELQSAAARGSLWLAGAACGLGLAACGLGAAAVASGVAAASPAANPASPAHLRGPEPPTGATWPPLPGRANDRVPGPSARPRGSHRVSPLAAAAFLVVAILLGHRFHLLLNHTDTFRWDPRDGDTKDGHKELPSTGPVDPGQNPRDAAPGGQVDFGSRGQVDVGSRGQVDFGDGIHALGAHYRAQGWHFTQQSEPHYSWHGWWGGWTRHTVAFAQPTAPTAPAPAPHVSPGPGGADSSPPALGWLARITQSVARFAGVHDPAHSSIGPVASGTDPVLGASSGTAGDGALAGADAADARLPALAALDWAAIQIRGASCNASVVLWERGHLSDFGRKIDAYVRVGAEGGGLLRWNEHPLMFSICGDDVRRVLWLSFADQQGRAFAVPEPLSAPLPAP